VSTSSSAGETASSPDGEAKHLSAPCGSTFRIDLWEDRTRGELWVPAYDPACLVLIDDEFSRTATGNAADIGRRRFEFRAVAIGTHHLLFEKRLGWKFTAEDRRVFSIAVTNGSASDPEKRSREA
jgi:predicted secreted protein